MFRRQVRKYNVGQINMFIFRLLQRQHPAAFRGEYDQWTCHDRMFDACGHCQDQVCIIEYIAHGSKNGLL